MSFADNGEPDQTAQQSHSSLIRAFVANLQSSWPLQNMSGNKECPGHTVHIRIFGTLVSAYSRISIARTPMARLPWLIRTHF